MQSLNIMEVTLLELQITHARNHLSISNKVQDPLKCKIYLCKVVKIEVAHIQCVNIYYAKFEYKGMNTIGVTDYTN